MRILNGTPASKGVAFGNVFVLEQQKPPSSVKIEDVSAQKQIFFAAQATATDDLRRMRAKMAQEVGEQAAEIFEIHAMMLEDVDFISGVVDIIENERVCADFAVHKNGQKLSSTFANMEDEYMRARAADIVDISRRVIDVIQNRKDADMTEILQPVVVVADELTPSQTVRFDRTKIAAFVTQKGSNASHAAILARTLGIPAVLAVGGVLEAEVHGGSAIVDGETGVVVLNPSAEECEKYEKRRAALDAETVRLSALIGKKSATADGIQVEICANIGHPSEASLAIANDADGIGLFRSEFLFLEATAFPSEDAQFEAYKKTVQAMNGKRVIVRTMDVGADKQLPYFNTTNEQNPAMGYRGIRVQLDRRDLLVCQLSALYRASAFGRVAIMLPMITSVEQVREVKRAMCEVEQRLDARGVSFNKDIELGVMIETPAAVMIADMLADEVDFFSIGTNDLTQYTLAVDRMNQSVAHMFDSLHPAILRMIRHVCDEAAKKAVWVGICGDSAANLELTEFYISCGVRELSVPPSMVLAVRERVRGVELTIYK